MQSLTASTFAGAKLAVAPKAPRAAARAAVSVRAGAYDAELKKTAVRARPRPAAARWPAAIVWV